MELRGSGGPPRPPGPAGAAVSDSESEAAASVFKFAGRLGLRVGWVSFLREFCEKLWDFESSSRRARERASASHGNLNHDSLTVTQAESCRGRRPATGHGGTGALVELSAAAGPGLSPSEASVFKFAGPGCSSEVIGCRRACGSLFCDNSDKSYTNRIQYASKTVNLRAHRLSTQNAAIPL